MLALRSYGAGPRLLGRTALEEAPPSLIEERDAHNVPVAHVLCFEMVQLAMQRPLIRGPCEILDQQLQGSIEGRCYVVPLNS